MGNNVDNGFLNKLNETLFKDGWLQNLYGTERANQQQIFNNNVAPTND